MASLLPGSMLKEVTSRPVKGRAAQFLYHENPDETHRHAERIVAILGVKITTSYDPQSGRGYHVQFDFLDSKLLSHGDWIIVDSFGKVSVSPEQDFKTYYEPERTKL